MINDNTQTTSKGAWVSCILSLLLFSVLIYTILRLRREKKGINGICTRHGPQCSVCFTQMPLRENPGVFQDHADFHRKKRDGEDGRCLPSDARCEAQMRRKCSLVRSDPIQPLSPLRHRLHPGRHDPFRVAAFDDLPVRVFDPLLHIRPHGDAVQRQPQLEIKVLAAPPFAVLHYAR